MGGTCRICDDPATRTVGDYAFCERHFDRSIHARRGARDADIASIVLLVVFVLIVYALDALVQPRLGDVALTIVGLILALVPAAVWLAFFYRQDRLEPEPRSMVIGEFLLGLLVAMAVAIPVLERMFDVGSWLFASPVAHLLGGVLIVGFVQEGLKYLALRLSVYDSREFDERTDGIIYGTAVGLGFATALNIAFVVGSGGVDLGSGAIRIVLTSLAHASFGGVIGYFLGRQKFERRPIWWMPAGVALAATLNGVFFFLRSTVARGTIEDPIGAVAPWIGLLLAALLAGAVTVALTTLTRRELERAVAGTVAEASG